MKGCTKHLGNEQGSQLVCRAEVNPQKERGKKTKQQVECDRCGRRSSGSPPDTDQAEAGHPLPSSAC